MRLFVKLQYNGRGFHGFQYQHGQRTVQGEIERILSKIHKSFVRIHPASRTDSGVHALEQCIHFDTTLSIPADHWEFMLNRYLPADISVTDTAEVNESFHARYDAEGKTYRYKIYHTKYKNPFYIGLKTHYPKVLDKEKMQRAMVPFVGRHDFTSFSSAKGAVKDKEREITEFQLFETEDGFEFVVTGTGFLYNMVRVMVAYVLEVGEGKREADTINIINQRERTLVPGTAPAEGLYLERIYYGTVQ